MTTPDDDLAAQLATHRFEAEFAPPAPRRVPAELKVGPVGRRRRDTVVGFGIAGLVCLGLSRLPVVGRWGETLVPLGHPDWIGAGLAAAGLLAAVYYALSRGPFEYVRSGEVLAGRVVGLEVRPVGRIAGQPASYAAFARVRYPDPTGWWAEREFRSQLVRAPGDGRAHSIDECEVSYRVGDSVTLVRLPNSADPAPQLYGFLGLRGDLGLVVGQARPLRKRARELLGFAAFMGAMLWNLHAVGSYSTLEFGAAQFAVLAVGAGLGFAGLRALYAADRRAWPAVEVANAVAAESGGAVRVEPAPGRRGTWGDAAVLSLGAMLLGASTLLCWALSLNALCDGAEPEARPAVVVGRKVTVMKFVWRSYEVTFHFRDDPPNEQRHFDASRAGFDALAGPDAVAHVSPGAFGWPWLPGLEPLKLGGPTDPNRE